MTDAEKIVTLAYPGPFTRRDNSRDHVEGPSPIDVSSLRVDGKGDPHLLDGQCSRRSPRLHLTNRQTLEEIHCTPCRNPRTALLGHQFIKKMPRAVTAPRLTHQETPRIGSAKSLLYLRVT